MPATIDLSPKHRDALGTPTGGAQFAGSPLGDCLEGVNSATPNGITMGWNGNEREGSVSQHHYCRRKHRPQHWSEAKDSMLLLSDDDTLGRAFIV